jgi:serine/threonine-protein kinase HipA
MSETLEAIFDGRRVGRISYKRDRLRFEYDPAWSEDRGTFPLSLSMPVTQREHDDAVVRPFLSGLLPDNAEVLRRWGRRFQVSAGNPFRLLSHVGEECAGAVQFVPEEGASRWLAGRAPEGVSWLTDDELVERISDLVDDHSRARRIGDVGQFSLAGAQAKIGLYRDSESKRWGIPEGSTPTTHILKPNVGAFDHYEQNEHFCLQLARRLGLQTAKSWTERIGDVSVIVVERFDRAAVGDRIMRIHQEDTCQALGRMPEIKYQNQGGPSAGEIFALIRDHSARLQEDVERFLDAMIYNWLIGGTDAHAKNYGFLLGGGGRIRLAPLYDLSSCLPYPHDIPPKKAKLAMKIGGDYLLWKIGRAHWEKAAAEWKLDPGRVVDRIVRMASALPEAVGEVGETMAVPGRKEKAFLRQLMEAIRDRAKDCRRHFTGAPSIESP